MDNIFNEIDATPTEQEIILHVIDVTMKMNNLQKNYYELEKQYLIARKELNDAKIKITMCDSDHYTKGIEICDNIIKLYADAEKNFDYNLRLKIDELRAKLVNTLGDESYSNSRHLFEQAVNCERKSATILELRDKKNEEIIDFQKKTKPTLPQELLQYEEEPTTQQDATQQDATQQDATQQDATQQDATQQDATHPTVAKR